MAAHVHFFSASAWIPAAAVAATASTAAAMATLSFALQPTPVSAASPSPRPDPPVRALAPGDPGPISAGARSLGASASGRGPATGNGSLSSPAGPDSATSEGASPVLGPLSPLSLLQVHVLFRHGDRSPMPMEHPGPSPAACARWEARLQTRPRDTLLPPREHSRGTEYPFGQLTRKGAVQAQGLGATLQGRYAGVLGLPLPGEGSADALRHQLAVRSTNFPRTYQSVFFVLTGLLGSEERAGSVAIEVRDDRDETLYENEHCARGALLWGRAWRESTSPRLGPDGVLADTGWRAAYQDAKQALIEFFKVQSKPRFPWVLATDNVACMLFHGDPLPSSLDPSTLLEIRDHLARDYARVFSIREVARLAMGPLIWEIESAMEKCVRAHSKNHSAHAELAGSPASAAVGAAGGMFPPPSPALQSQGVPESAAGDGGGSVPRLLLYSGHDATIMPLAAAFGVAPDTWPPYSSWFALELWGTADGAQHFVRVLYNGEEVPLPISLPPSSPTASWLDPGPWQRTSSAFEGLEKGQQSSSPLRVRKTVVLCPWDHFTRLASWARMSPQEHHEACKGPHSNL